MESGSSSPVANGRTSPQSFTHSPPLDNSQDWGVLTRIADTFQMSINPIAEKYKEVTERCFERAIEECQRHNWIIIDFLQKDLGAITDFKGRTFLTRALEKQPIFLVNQLLSYPSFITKTDREGRTALHVASAIGSLSIYPKLLNPSLLEVRNQQGETPIHTAILAGKHESLSLLLKNKANPHAIFNWNEIQVNALSLAVLRGANDCVDILFSKDLFQQFPNIGNLLHLAMYASQSSTIRHCLNKYSSLLEPLLQQEDSNGLIPMQLAEALGKEEICHIFNRTEAPPLSTSTQLPTHQPILADTTAPLTTNAITKTASFTSNQATKHYERIPDFSEIHSDYGLMPDSPKKKEPVYQATPNHVTANTASLGMSRKEPVYMATPDHVKAIPDKDQETQLLAQIVRCQSNALEIEKKLLGENNIQVAMRCQELGNAHYKSGEFAQSLEYHLQALTVQQRIHGKDHANTASSHHSVACSYFSLKRHKEALEEMHTAIRIQRKNGVDRLTLLASYKNISVILLALENYEAALEYANLKYDIQRELTGGLDLDTATSNEKMAVLLRKLKRFDEARAQDKNALRIRVTLNNQHLAAQSHARIGENYSLQERHKEALKYYQTALDTITVVENGENSLLAARIYNYLGSCFWALKLYKDATKHDEKALGIYVNILGKEHPVVASCRNNLGWCYGELGNLKKALKQEKEVLKFRMKVLPEDDLDLATSYNNVGTTLTALKKEKATALSYKQEALKIRLKKLEPNDLLIVISKINIGISLGGLKRHVESGREFLEALEICKNTVGEKHEQTVRCYNCIGVSFGMRERYDDALEYLMKAFTLAGELFTDDHMTHEYCLHNLLITLEKHPDPEIQEKTTEEVYAQCVERFGDGHKLLSLFKKSKKK
ncbi:MAG: hypothetical protein K940chlam7_01256 [Chlamydiae bacterium]|nr:hypothetical protein [Chlamydiota bacterium]